MKTLTALWIATSILAAYAITARLDEIGSQYQPAYTQAHPQAASAVIYPADHMPAAHGGLGCMTDSECEGIDSNNSDDADASEPRASDTLLLAPMQGD